MTGASRERVVEVALDDFTDDELMAEVRSRGLMAEGSAPPRCKGEVDPDEELADLAHWHARNGRWGEAFIALGRLFGPDLCDLPSFFEEIGC